MARGGRRSGNKGTKYPNRSDLRAPTAPTGLPYGERGKLIAAQRAVPMGPPPAATGPAQGSGSPPSPAPEPGSLPFTGPTERPNEPVTAGLPMGPGPGPEVLSMNQATPQDPIYLAVAALDALGDKADSQTAHLRDAVHATMANRNVP